MVHLSLLEFFCLDEKDRFYFRNCMTCYSFRPASGIYLEGKIMHMKIICVLVYKERIPREQNCKTFEKAYTDHRSAVPNSLIFQILTHTTLRIPQNHLTLCPKHLKFLKTQQQQVNNQRFLNSQTSL